MFSSPIIIFTGVSLALYSYFILRCTMGFGKARRTKKNDLQFGVSIVVPFRNEGDGLKKTIECLLAQDYPSDLMDIILVNDHSEYQFFKPKSTDRYSVVDVPKFKSGKKYAIDFGINQAKYDCIVTIDADIECGPEWLSSMVKWFDEETKVLLGPVMWTKKDSFLNGLLRLEMVSIQGVTGGLVGNELPFMANGANLMFSKEAYLDVLPFEKSEGISSGDDMDIVREIADVYGSHSVRYCIQKEAEVLSDAPSNLKSLFDQRLRWAGKSKNYNQLGKWVTLRIVLANLAVLLTLIGSIFGLVPVKFFVSTLMIKTMVDVLMASTISSYFNWKGVLKYALPLEIIYPFYTLYIGVVSQFKKPNWKGRKVIS